MKYLRMCTVCALFCTLFLLPACSSDNEPALPEIIRNEYPVNDLLQQGDAIAELWISNPYGSPFYGLGGTYLWTPERGSLIGLKAYDRACPNEWDSGAEPNILYRKEVGETRYVLCEECGSEYDLSNGRPTQGPARSKGIALVEYQIERDGSWLIITNPRYKE